MSDADRADTLTAGIINERKRPMATLRGVYIDDHNTRGTAEISFGLPGLQSITAKQAAKMFADGDLKLDKPTDGVGIVHQFPKGQDTHVIAGKWYVKTAGNPTTVIEVEPM